MLSLKFLEEVADKNCLSHLQKLIFTRKFLNAEYGEIKNDGEVVDVLLDMDKHEITEKTVSNCMSEVYRKFELEGHRPGKANLLFTKLLKEFQKQLNECSPSISSPSKTSDSVFHYDATTRSLVEKAPLLQIDQSSLRRVEESLDEFSSVISKKKGS